MSAFGLPSSAANKDDHSRVEMVGDQRQKVVPITGDQKQLIFTGITKYFGIIGMYRHRLTELDNVMTFPTQDPSDFGTTS